MHPHDDHYNNIMDFSRFVEIPAVHDLPDLSSSAMSRSPSLASSNSSASASSASSPCLDNSSMSMRLPDNSCSNTHQQSYRSLQRENHDLRKLLGQLRTKLDLATLHLAEEESKQDVLQHTVADLQASLDEVRARSLDVLEDNNALRDENRRLSSSQQQQQSSLESPLDRQLRAQQHALRFHGRRQQRALYLATT